MGAFLTIYQRLPIYADVMTDPAATWVIVRFHRPPFLPCVVVDSFLTLSTMPALISVDNTLGALLIGTVLSSMCVSQ